MRVTDDKKNQSKDFELNIASIIDCLTVLITFTLASASFLSIGILDAGVTAGGDMAKSDNLPEVFLTVDIKNNGFVEVTLHGKEKFLEKINPQNSKIDLGKLTLTLKNFKEKWKNVGSVTLLADAAITYQEVIMTMDEIRKTFSIVMLGGF
ncbi:MAG: biopolymer transporter ExbD [Bdellovibrio sp.]|nr:biopolymer transporter ExbD [Bdellovibrio sp.]